MVLVDIDVDGEQKKLYIDGKLDRAIDTKVIPTINKKDNDWVWIVDGGEGCQPKGSKVLMANGIFKNIEDIKVNDIILSPQEDGINLFVKVTRVCSWFSNENYDVIELNRDKKKLYTCSYNHLIPLNYKVSPRINGNRLKEDSYWKIKHYEAKTLSKLSKKTIKKNTTTITSFKIDKFLNRDNCKIEPYTLGVYLGDGSFCNNLSITSQNKEMMDEIIKYYDIIRISNKIGTKTLDYHFSKLGIFAKQLKKYNLQWKRSGDKFIPREALYSDIEYRKKLLAGLIDTDGYLDKGQGYSITTKSKQLAEDILYLIYSLGGRGKINKIKKGIKKLNFIGEYYNISFYLNNIDLPLKVEYKIRNKQFFYLSANRISIDVIPSQSSEVFGIEIDSPSKWYITDNFTITHNSGKSMLAQQLAKKVDPTFDISRMCMTPIEFTKAVIHAKKGQCVIFDEAFTGLSSRASLTEQSRLLVALMMEMRQKNLFIIIVMPTIFLLDKYAALWRARGLFHVYTKNGQRGRWIYFNGKKKKLLYMLGKKTYNYTFPRSKFRGRFYELYTINEEEYRTKKKESLMKKSRLSRAELYQEQRDILINIFHKQYNLTAIDISKICKDNHFNIARRTISDILNKEPEQTEEILEDEGISEQDINYDEQDDEME